MLASVFPYPPPQPLSQAVMEERAEAMKQGIPLDTGVYSLVPPGAPRGNNADFWGVDWEPTLGKWLAPFFMQVQLLALLEVIMHAAAVAT